MSRLARPLMYAGIVAIVLGMSKAHAAVIADPPYDYTGSARFAWSIGFIGVLAVSAYGVGLPDVPRTTRSTFVTAIASAGLSAVTVSLVQLLSGDALLPRFVVFGSAMLLIPWYMLCAALASSGRARAEERDRVVLVVAGTEESSRLEQDLERSPERPASIVAVLQVDELAQPGAPVTLRAVALEAEATVVVLDRPAQGLDAVVQQVAELHESGVRVRTLSLFYEEWIGKLPISELERVSLMFDIGEVHRTRYGRAARLFDLAISLVGAVVLVLMIPLIVVGDLIANRGPLFFSQPRVGKGGQAFRILKFRTMRPGAHEQGEWTEASDPRVTRFGRLLRRSHLDELPQVVNILRGDLSVVGPRPEQPLYVEELDRKLPFYDLRHVVRPGLTGWAQVKYHYGADEDDALEKLQYEFYYLRHQGFALDARIVGRTVRSILGRSGR